MSTPEHEQVADPLEVQAAQLRNEIGDRLHRLATFLGEMGDAVQNPSRNPADLPLQVGSRALADTVYAVEALTNGDPSAARERLYRETLPTFAHSKGASRSEAHPDVPFYRSIIPAEQFAPVEQPDPADAIYVHIIGPRHIQVGETVCELRGEPLYVFNVLLHRRDAPITMREMASYGLPHSNDFNNTGGRLRQGMAHLEDLLCVDFPKNDRPQLIERTGPYKTPRRRLSSRVVCTDKRGEVLPPPPNG